MIFHFVKSSLLFQGPHRRAGELYSVLSGVPCAPINVNPVGGGGSAGKGWGFDQEVKIWSIAQGWGSIRSPNVVKNPHPGAKYQIKDEPCSYL